MKKTAVTVFSILSFFSMLTAILTSVKNPRRSYFSWFEMLAALSQVKRANLVAVVFAIFLCILLLYLLRKTRMKLTLYQLSVIIVIESVGLLIFLFAFRNYISFEGPVYDSKWVMYSLEQFREFGSFRWMENGQLNGEYLVTYPNNVFLMAVYSLIQTIFGDNYSGVIITFAFFYLFTIWIVYWILIDLNLSANTIFWIIQILFFAFQYLAHIIIAYTDILCLPFVALSFLFFVKYIKQEVKWKKISYLLLSCLLASVGMLAKGTVLILILSLIVYLFVEYKNLKKVICIVPLIILLFVNSFWKSYIDRANLFDIENIGIANTHWVVMGLSNTPIPEDLSEDENAGWLVGIYNVDDYNYSSSLLKYEKMTSKEQTKVHLNIIKDRLTRMSFKQWCDAMYNKITINWGYGDTMVSEQLISEKSQEDRDTDPRLDIFKPTRQGKLLYVYMTTIQYLIYMLIASASLKNLKVHKPLTFLCTIFISGYFVFLMIWEANPRYSMLVYIPAILMFSESFGTKAD